MESGHYRYRARHWGSQLKGAKSELLELLVRVNLIRRLLGDDIKVVLLKESKILTGLRELALFHTLADIPVDEGTLRVHHVILLGDSFSEDTAHGNVVSDHGHVPLRDLHGVLLASGGRNFVQANLEPGRAPLDEGDLIVLLQPLDGSVRLLRLDRSTVVHRDGHVLVLHWIEVGVFHKHVLGLEDVVRDLADGLGLVRSLRLTDHWRKSGGHEVESREGHQVRLELPEIAVQLSIEAEGRSHGGDDLGDDNVEIRVAGALDVQLLLAD